MYCKLLIILGLAFPMAEQISEEISVGTYQLFYVYLYLGSLLFLIFVYIDVMRTKASNTVSKKVKRAGSIRQSENLSGTSNQTEGRAVNQKNHTLSKHSGNINDIENNPERPISVDKIPVVPRPRVHYGSFYLRIGCLCKYIFLYVTFLKRAHIIINEFL